MSNNEDNYDDDFTDEDDEDEYEWNIRSVFPDYDEDENDDVDGDGLYIPSAGMRDLLSIEQDKALKSPARINRDGSNFEAEFIKNPDLDVSMLYQREDGELTIFDCASISGVRMYFDSLRKSVRPDPAPLPKGKLVLTQNIADVMLILSQNLKRVQIIKHEFDRTFTKLEKLANEDVCNNYHWEYYLIQIQRYVIEILTSFPMLRDILKGKLTGHDGGGLHKDFSAIKSRHNRIQKETINRYEGLAKFTQELRNYFLHNNLPNLDIISIQYDAYQRRPSFIRIYLTFAETLRHKRFAGDGFILANKYIFDVDYTKLRNGPLNQFFNTNLINRLIKRCSKVASYYSSTIEEIFKEVLPNTLTKLKRSGDLINDEVIINALDGNISSDIETFEKCYNIFKPLRTVYARYFIYESNRRIWRFVHSLNDVLCFHDYTSLFDNRSDHAKMRRPKGDDLFDFSRAFEDIYKLHCEYYQRIYRLIYENYVVNSRSKKYKEGYNRNCDISYFDDIIDKK